MKNIIKTIMLSTLEANIHCQVFYFLLLMKKWTDLLSCQVAQVVQPPLTDLEVPKEKREHDWMGVFSYKYWGQVHNLISTLIF